MKSTYSDEENFIVSEQKHVLSIERGGFSAKDVINTKKELELMLKSFSGLVDGDDILIISKALDNGDLNIGLRFKVRGNDKINTVTFNNIIVKILMGYETSLNTLYSKKY